MDQSTGILTATRALQYSIFLIAINNAVSTFSGTKLPNFCFTQDSSCKTYRQVCVRVAPVVIIWKAPVKLTDKSVYVWPLSLSLGQPLL